MNRLFDHVRLPFLLTILTAAILSLIALPRSVPVVSADGATLELLGTFGGTTRAIAVIDDYLLVGEGQRLAVFDISVPGSLVLAGKSPVLPGVVHAIAVDGNRVYVGLEYRGFAVLDFTNRTAPVVLGTLETPNWITLVAAAGNYVYASSSIGGLQIIDVSNPTAPSFVSELAVVDGAGSLAVAGNIAYVTDLESLHLLDITTPENPVELATYGLQGEWVDFPIGMAIAGDYAYLVSTDNSLLEIIDISDPANPAGIGILEDLNDALNVTVVGDVAYAVGRQGGLTTIDVSDRDNPAEIGNIAYRRDGADALPFNAVIVGDFAYLFDYYGLRVIDVADPADLIESVATDAPEAYFNELAVSDNLAFIPGEFSGLMIVDITDPTSPEQIGNFKDPGYTQVLFVDVEGDYAYGTDGDVLRVIDITNPTAPTQVGFLDVTDVAYQILVEGGYAYIASGSGAELRVIDISNPTAPIEVGFADLAGGIQNISMSGNYLFASVSNFGISIIDVSNPAAPVEIATYDTLGTARDVTVAGDYAYVADGNAGGLRIIDVSDTTLPNEIGSYDTPGGAVSVAVNGATAYVGDGPNSWLSIDVSNPASPVELAQYDSPNGIQDIDVAGDRLYLLGEQSGLFIFGPPPDDDDGQSVAIEDAAPNNGDGNSDGIPDSQQANVTSLPNSENGQYLTVAVPEGATLEAVAATGNPSPGDTPGGASFPLGFLSFIVNNVTSGGSVAVEIIPEGGTAGTTYYKYGPTPGDPTDHWYEFSFDGTTGAEILPGNVILHLVDGLRGDADLTANGMIEDPGALATVATIVEPVAYFSPTSNIEVNDASYQDEDILAYDESTDTWSLAFDGSDVGLSKTDVDAFYVIDDYTLLISIDTPLKKLPGLPTTQVDDSDIVRFTATSIGETTTGSFELYFDGSDVGLTTGNEDIDALAFTQAGDLVVSLVGNVSVPGPSGAIEADDKDLLVFDDLSLGSATAGTWALYFDGSDVHTNFRDIKAAWIDSGTGDILVAFDKKSILGPVTVNTYDILRCVPGSLGTTTTCTTLDLYWQGAQHGFAGKHYKIDGFGLSSE